ncbi:MAG: hypothetical protein JWQ71_2334 [Pedosphaera sp.]|nr:hypothetical protein [Pedosphaera sp.]
MGPYLAEKCVPMRVYFILMTLVASVVFGTGCRKAEPAAKTPDQKENKIAAPASKATNDFIGRIHFIGSTQVFADTNSARLKEIGNLPVTGELREHILQKLATAPFRLLEQRAAQKTNDHAVLIRPLCEDLLRAESYVEMRGATNPTPEVMLAIHLDNNRAELWRTNLSTTLSSWTGIPIKEIEANGVKGWELRKHHAPNIIRFLRAGDWVLFGWGQDELLLQTSLIDRIKKQGRPVVEAKNYWLDAWVDWPSLALQHTNLANFKLPKTQITVTATKEFIRPKVIMEFDEPLNVQLPPWQVPTNIIHDPLISFTAVRGIAPWLKQINFIQQLNLDKVPDEYFIWAMKQVPLETCLVAPVQNGTNFMAQFAPQAVSLANTNLQKRRIGQVEWKTNKNQISWTGLPMIVPYLEMISTPQGDYMKGGIFPSPPRGTPPPAELLNQLGANSNVIYYDWEITEERLPQTENIIGLVWLASGRFLSQPDITTQKWLDAVAPKLGNCGTMGTLTGPNEVTILRNSPIGLTGFELTMLKHWLDSPKFPWGFSNVRERSGVPKRPLAPPAP